MGEKWLSLGVGSFAATQLFSRFLPKLLCNFHAICSLSEMLMDWLSYYLTGRHLNNLGPCLVLVLSRMDNRLIVLGPIR